eukprot:8178433-Alexandrium_andersonii.AAC.1
MRCARASPGALQRPRTPRVRAAPAGRAVSVAMSIRGSSVLPRGCSRQLRQGSCLLPGRCARAATTGCPCWLCELGAPPCLASQPLSGASGTGHAGRGAGHAGRTPIRGAGTAPKRS